MPDFSKRTPPKLLDILKHLPQTNCRECGVPSCMTFAAELIEGSKRLADCPALAEESRADALRQFEDLGLGGMKGTNRDLSRIYNVNIARKFRSSGSRGTP